MRFLDAAIEVLRTSSRPLTTKEIVDAALKRGLLHTNGKTPVATMSAQLYRHAGGAIRRVAEPGRGRARRGTVRWMLSGAQRGHSSGESAPS